MDEESDITRYYIFNLGVVKYKFKHSTIKGLEFLGPRTSQEGLYRRADLNELTDPQEIKKIFYSEEIADTEDILKGD